jgi:hypothetical protein
MNFSSKRGILLLVAAVLLTAATFAPPAQGARPLIACPSLRCPNGVYLVCSGLPCGINDNCSIVCEGQFRYCPGVCYPE